MVLNHSDTKTHSLIGYKRNLFDLIFKKPKCGNGILGSKPIYFTVHSLSCFVHVLHGPECRPWPHNFLPIHVLLIFLQILDWEATSHKQLIKQQQPVKILCGCFFSSINILYICVLLLFFASTIVIYLLFVRFSSFLFTNCCWR